MGVEPATTSIKRASSRARPCTIASRPGGASSGPSTRSRPRSRSDSRAGASGAQTRERLVAAEQLEALEEPGRDLRAGDREPDRLERVARLLAELVGERAQGLLEPGRLPRLDRLEALERGARTIAGSAPSGDTSSKRNRTKSGYCENFSIFSCTSGAVAWTVSSGQSMPCSVSHLQSEVRVLVRLQRAQVGRRSSSRASRSRTSPGSARRARARSARRARGGDMIVVLSS